MLPSNGSVSSESKESVKREWADLDLSSKIVGVSAFVVAMLFIIGVAATIVVFFISLILLMVRQW